MNSSMRIVEVISGLGHGGAERALANRLRFAPQQVETHVISTTPTRSDTATAVKALTASLTFLSGSLPSASLASHIRMLQPDIVITHNPREAVRILAHPTLTREIPVIVIAHNEITSEYRWKATLLDFALGRMNKRAALHLAVSGKAAIGKQCRGASRTATALLGGSADTSAIPDYSFWPDGTRLRFASVSRFSPQKNLHSLVSAISMRANELNKARAHVAMVGEGELRRSLEKQISSLKIGHLVTLPGWVSNSSNLLTAADALLITSTFEGGPLTLYEALITGTRVMSTPVGAAPDLLKGDQHSKLIEDSSPQSIARGLDEMIEAGELNSIERISRQTASAKYSAGTLAAEFYDKCYQIVNTD